MNEEIKEILEYISSRTIDDCLLNDYFTQLEDYITNLQMEIDQSQEIMAELTEENEIRQQDINNLTYQLAKMKEENERLKEIIKQDNHILGCNFASKDKYKQRYEDYKSRCEKAIEYIKKNRKYVSTQMAEDTRVPVGSFMWNIDDLLNILQNGSDSQ